MRQSPCVLPSLVLSALVATGCCGMGADDQNRNAPDAASSTSLSASAAPAASTAEAPTPAPPPKAEREIAGAAHILIAWKGADRAPKTVTRSKEEAKKRAAEVLAKVKEGKASFEELVKQYTDDEISKPANGALGNFERNAMPAAFADATFAMAVGSYSDVVETPQGFHIIKRTK